MNGSNLFSVKERIAIITGGLGQIGAEFVKEFLRGEAFVAVFGRDVSEEKQKKAFPAEVLENPALRFFPVDITNKETIVSALDEVEALWGTPNILINNAGVDTQPSAPPSVSGPFEDFPEAVFREVVEVNLVGTFLVTQVVGARMARAGRGSIINVGSIYGMLSPIQDIYAYKAEKTGVPFIKPVAYSASKSGIYNLTRYCATYWGKKGVRVNTLTPSGVYRNTQDIEFQTNYCNRMPMGRMAQPDEYNGAVIFLASDASKYMTGSNLVVDGGWTAW